MWKREWYPSGERGVYMAALDALEADQLQMEGLRELHESIPPEDVVTREALPYLFSFSTAPQVLDAYKMRELGERDPQLHGRITDYHQRWLAAQLFG